MPGVGILRLAWSECRKRTGAVVEALRGHLECRFGKKVVKLCFRVRVRPTFTLRQCRVCNLGPYRLLVAARATLSEANTPRFLVALTVQEKVIQATIELNGYLRLTSERTTKITRIRLPKITDVAHKFVREAVQAYPEIYFSRLVILGEGDSEEIVLPRILRAKGIPVDESAVTVAPLGDRHVNHFWRLLSALEIPYLPLLDLDVARHQGGWGRIKYVNDQLGEHAPANQLPTNYGIPAWNSAKEKVRAYPHYLEQLENRSAFFSYPMDLDFAMLLAFPDEYGVEQKPPGEATIKAVLGDSHGDTQRYDDDELALFGTYHKRFKLGSNTVSQRGASIVHKDTLDNI